MLITILWCILHHCTTVKSIERVVISLIIAHLDKVISGQQCEECSSIVVEDNTLPQCNNYDYIIVSRQ